MRIFLYVETDDLGRKIKMSIQGSIKCNNGGKITAGLYGKVCKVAVKEGQKSKKEIT